MLTIIGLGTEPEDLSLRAHNAVLAAPLVVAKTREVRAFGYFERYHVPVVTLDEVFGRSRSFDTLYKNLGKEVLRLAGEHGSLCYCVEGSGADDRSVQYILRKCPDARLLPACEKGSELSRFLGASSCAVYAAYDFAAQGYREIDHAVPLLVREIDSAFLASEVKLRLFSAFAEETEVLAACGGKVRRLPLYELDRLGGYDSSFSVLLLPEGVETRRRFGFRDLVDIVVRLRAPDGCPWDREQDHDTIRMNLLEEAYEALEAVELKDADKMCEEMGDMLLQPVFHAVMGEEAGEFSVSDMLSELCRKLVFRHSHIFGTDRASGGEEALKVWERNKSIEKNQQSVSDELRDLPKTFPALLYAQKLLKKARKVFPELDSPAGAQASLEEAFAALKDSEAPTDELFGDALLAAVNVLRLKHAEPELALRHAADRLGARVTEREAVCPDPSAR